MIRLTVPTANRWLDLPQGVRVEVLPRLTALDAASSSEATRRTAKEQADAQAAAAAGQPLDASGYTSANPSVLNGLFWQYQTESLMRFGIRAWEGVGDADGVPLPVSAEAVAMLSAIPSFATAFRNAYDATTVAVVAEGNGSGNTSGGDTPDPASTASVANSGPAPTETLTAPAAVAAPPS